MKSLPNSVSRKAFALVAISDPSRVDDFLSAQSAATTTPTRILNLDGKRCNKGRRPFDQAYSARRTDTFRYYHNPGCGWSPEFGATMSNKLPSADSRCRCGFWNPPEITRFCLTG